MAWKNAAALACASDPAQPRARHQESHRHSRRSPRAATTLPDFSVHQGLGICSLQIHQVMSTTAAAFLPAAMRNKQPSGNSQETTELTSCCDVSLLGYDSPRRRRALEPAGCCAPSNVSSSRRAGHPVAALAEEDAEEVRGRQHARSSSRRFVAVRAPERASCSRERCERSIVRTVTSASVSRAASAASPRASAARSADSSAVVRCRHTLTSGDCGETGEGDLRCASACRCSSS